ncbi:formin-like protein 6 isoform X2 [Strongylocentrotus purpuratus]|uniref:Uncharacterized protein n=1 Tax=Strongylocentrotus purpuratus TaxID=7668 RepID=A0A7M7TG66_STRPU|nr:formin-like protein 6 isoform X2 [Strongylocentrotus purpuratus]
MGCASSAQQGPSAYPKQPPKAPPPQQQQVQPQRANPPPPQPQAQPQVHVHQQSMQMSTSTGPPPVQQQPPPPPPQQTATPEHADITEELVNSLLELDSQIAMLESRNVFKQYQMKKEQSQKVDGQVKSMTVMHQQLDAQTKKEYEDVVNLQHNTSVRQMWSQQQFDAQMSKEQQEYMDALNKQEIHQKQLAALSQQFTLLTNEVTALKTDKTSLQGLYEKQDATLASIFDGKYGSDAEYRLESELDMLLERKQRVAVARYKWNNSHTLAKHACGQLSFGIRRWADVLQIPAQNTQIRYQFAAEARNNLVAAAQNIKTSQQYLNTIKFPYCTPDEIETLNKAIANIFSDMMHPDRHKHAMECYVTVYKRSAALIQWFEHVINKTINKDLEKTAKNCASKQKELKMERMKLVQEKVKEKLGADVASRLQARSQANDAELIEDKDEPELAMLVDADSVSQAGDVGVAPEGSTEMNAPTPLGLEDLAPTPAMDDIFGNIEELKKQHDEQVKEYERQQEVNKTRADQDLQSKLAARRSRRQRQEAQEAEIAAMQGSTPY